MDRPNTKKLANIKSSIIRQYNKATHVLDAIKRIFRYISKRLILILAQRGNCLQNLGRIIHDKIVKWNSIQVVHIRQSIINYFPIVQHAENFKFKCTPNPEQIEKPYHTTMNPPADLDLPIGEEAVRVENSFKKKLYWKR